MVQYLPDQLDSGPEERFASGEIETDSFRQWFTRHAFDYLNREDGKEIVGCK
jgi:hypothetical protein